MSHRLILRRLTFNPTEALRITRSLSNWSRWSYQRANGSKWGYAWGALIGVTGSLAFIAHRSGSKPIEHCIPFPRLHAEEKKEDQQKKDPGVSLRENRFKEFASLSYKGELYMTAADFLESTTRDMPRGKAWALCTVCVCLYVCGCVVVNVYHLTLISFFACCRSLSSGDRREGRLLHKEDVVQTTPFLLTHTHPRWWLRQ